jgi:hypothetical protein
MSQTGGFKICPFCKEEIREEAVKCRFCGEWLQTVADAAPQQLRGTADSSPISKTEEPRGGAANEKSAEETQVKRELPPKVLYLSSVGLLSICAALFFLRIVSLDWSSMSPGRQGETIAKLFVAFCWLALGGLFCVNRKLPRRYRLFYFSAYLAICGVAFYFYPGQTQNPQRSPLSTSNAVANVSQFLQFARNGATEKLPELAPTGDANLDAVFKAMKSLLDQSAQLNATERTELDALRPQGVFDWGVLTNKTTLEAEIEKRTSSQRVIQRYITYTLELINNVRPQFDALPEQYRQKGRQGLENFRLNYEAGAGLRLKQQKAEENYLQFMRDFFDDYRLSSTHLAVRKAHRTMCVDLRRTINQADVTDE